MSISTRLSRYLEQHDTQYEICAHRPSRTSAETARSAHIAPNQLAKSVMLEDDSGLLMAVVPGDRSVMLGELGRLLGRKELRLSEEINFADLFDDCEPGALPPVGMAWGIETVVDDELGGCDTVYLEAGDHERLLRLSRDQFRHLMGGARHGYFCRQQHH